MSAYIKIFNNDSEGYRLLSRAAQILTGANDKGTRYFVDDTYFDFGQDWKWTTILCDSGNGWPYQALCPADQERILNAKNGVDLVDAVRKVLTR